MGQAFRRAAGRLRTTSIDTSSSSSSSSSSTISRSKTPFDQTPPPPAVPTHTHTHIQHKDSALEGNSEDHAQILEQKESSDVRDSDYEAMLGQMVGRISTKPGGKLEMGEAYVVRKSNRAMPRLRNTTPDNGRYEERPVAAGTLNVAQLRHILRLHQGKADGYEGNVGPKEIAEKFRLDPTQVERIFNFVSMPAEDNTKQKKHDVDD